MSDDQNTAVLDEPIVKTRHQPKTDTKTTILPPYNVVILNDEEHTFEYVVELLVKLFRHDIQTAANLTLAIHMTGRAIVYTTHKEKAEFKRDQVLAYGPDIRMGPKSTGSLRCVIEPAQG